MSQTQRSSLRIDLDGLESKWATSGKQICAVCGFDFDFQPDDPDPDNEGNAYKVPLLLWRKDCTEMLTMCWECATIRMQNKRAN